MEATAATTAPAGGPSALHELKTLVLSRHPGIVIETHEGARASQLVQAVAGDLDLPRFEWSVTGGLCRAGELQGVYQTNEPSRALGAIGELPLEAIFELRDFSSYLDKPELSRAFRDLLERVGSPNRLSTLVLVEAQAKLPPEIEPYVIRYEMRLPPRASTAACSMWSGSRCVSTGAHVEIGPEDHDEFCAALSGLTLNQARQAVARAAIEDGRLSRDDLSRLAQYKAEALEEDGLLEYFPPADNTFSLGGFANLRRWLERARVGFTPEAAELGLNPPKGLMLVGVQGCGKSLAAKVIAREWGLPLLKLDAGRLFDKYIGETERNFRKAIAIAESCAPAVLWIDELEKAITPGGAGGESDGGLSRRLFGSFLTWLQEKQAPVFVVATANDLSLLPPELLRKGRFDEIFFVDLPEADERAQILRIHLELRRQDPEYFDLAALVEAADGFSGAEIEQVVVASLLGALQSGAQLSTELLLSELGATVPLSVTRAEDVRALRQSAQGRFVPVR